MILIKFKIAIKIFFLITVFLFLKTENLFSQNESVVIKEIRGYAFVKLSSESIWKTAKVNQRLNKNDKVKTKINSFIVFSNNIGTYILKQNKEVSIKNIISAILFKNKMKMGKVTSKNLKKLKNKEKFKVKTPVMVAGVRGKKQSEDLEVDFIEDEIEKLNNKNSNSISDIPYLMTLGKHKKYFYIDRKLEKNLSKKTFIEKLKLILNELQIHEITELDIIDNFGIIYYIFLNKDEKIVISKTQKINSIVNPNLYSPEFKKFLSK